MTKDQFREELFEFQVELGENITKSSFFDDHDYIYHEYSCFPVKYIRKINLKNFDDYLLAFRMQPDPSISFDIHLHSKLLFDSHPLKDQEKKWMNFGSKSHDYAQRWNRTVYDLLKSSMTNKYEKEILLLEKFFDEYFINPTDYESLIGRSSILKNDKKSGGRPKDPTLDKKKDKLNKEYYKLTKEKGYKTSKAIELLTKKFGWKKSTIETYLK